MRKYIFMFLVMCSVCSGAVQSGWMDWDNTSNQGNLNPGAADEYWVFISQSQNQHCCRDGTIVGASIRLANVATIRGLGFGVLRPTGGANEYTVVGKSEEITSGFSAGNNTFTFSSPIENVQSTDLFAVWANINDTASMIYHDTATDMPIQDSATKIRWYDSGNAAYATIDTGDTFTTNGGGTVFGVIYTIPLMDSPKVIGVGDSIARGAPIHNNYRANDGGNKTSATFDRMGGFMEVAYRALGWSYESAGNTTASNSAAEVISDDFVKQADEQLTLWEKSPEYIHLHVGVNDINDARSWANYLADLNTIVSTAATNGAKVIMTAIFPWTGKADNSTGTHAQNTTRDTWNNDLEAWAKSRSNVYFVNINKVLGQERLVAKGADGTPTAGNLWDLKEDTDGTDYYAETDGGTALGVHLSQQGCAAAGGAIAAALTELITNQQERQINRLRARYIGSRSNYFEVE